MSLCAHDVDTTTTCIGLEKHNSWQNTPYGTWMEAVFKYVCVKLIMPHVG